MGSVEREEEGLSHTQQWKTSLKRWLNADDFPAGAFTIFCAIMGGVANYKFGLWYSEVTARYQPTILFIWSLLGIAGGIGIAVVFLNWLADFSND